ncbi:gamma-2-syntrophin-like isoform X1 [Branchiostoma floridae x Branchiostoma japonicum]
MAGETPQSVEVVKVGFLGLSDGKREPEIVRVQLTSDSLVLQREETVYGNSLAAISSQVNNFDIDSNRERSVILRRQKSGGLGLSIKGGAEHNIPVLISRIFKDQAADQTGQLFVGDAIIKVNGVNVEHSTHDDVVQHLKNSPDDVKLTVRYYRAATPYLRAPAKRSRYSSETCNGNATVAENDTSNSEWKTPPRSPTVPLTGGRYEKRWTNILTIPLAMAALTKYQTGTDKLRPNSFEVWGGDGVTSAVLHCNNVTEVSDWCRVITTAIAAANATFIKISNDTASPLHQITHMGWMSERIGASKSFQNWKPRFVALRGEDMFIMDTPPVSQRDWVRCDRMYKLHELMCKMNRDQEVLDDRLYCLGVQLSTGESCYLSVETKEELTLWLGAIQTATHHAVRIIGRKTFGVSWQRRLSALTLDFTSGFTLYDGENKTVLWTYKFSQLKGSSDDNKSKIKLLFQSPNLRHIETQELECPSLQALLFSMHAFLSAKLAAVDPMFVRSLANMAV